MGVPCGLSTTMAIGLTDGGPVTVFWGSVNNPPSVKLITDSELNLRWIIVSLISMCIAASLAEICSVFPTSGGVYYWAHLMSSPRYATRASWITGWLGLVGNITVTLSINFSFALLVMSAISLWDETFEAKAWQTLLVFWGMMLLCAAINVWGSKHLDKVCLFMYGLVKPLTAVFRSIRYAFTGLEPRLSLSWSLYSPSHPLRNDGVANSFSLNMTQLHQAGQLDGRSSWAYCRRPTP